MAVFSFPSNYEGDNARTYIKTQKGHFDRTDIVLLKFPSAVKNLHFDTIDQMQIDGVVQPGNYAEAVTLTNIPPHVTEIWFDFDYLDTYKGTFLIILAQFGYYREINAKNYIKFFSYEDHTLSQI